MSRPLVLVALAVLFVAGLAPLLLMFARLSLADVSTLLDERTLALLGRTVLLGVGVFREAREQCPDACSHARKSVYNVYKSLFGLKTRLLVSRGLRLLAALPQRRQGLRRRLCAQAVHRSA